MLEQLSNIKNVIPSLKSFRELPSMARREMKLGLLFMSPWIFGFLVFTFLPMVASLAFSFTDIKLTDNILQMPNFVGFDNWAQLFKDGQVWDLNNSALGSLWITLKFGLFALPVGIFVPLGLAVLMNSKYLKAPNFFRSMFYMPYIVPFVAAIFLWGGMLNTESGWINRVLLWIFEPMGVTKDMLPQWANDVTWVYPSYVIMGIWGVGNAMLIMLAGLQGVPTELYDAAKVDGANQWQTFWKVTFPMISPVIFYNLTLSVVGLFQYFLVPLVVNNGTGRPGGATNFYNLYLYKTAFVFFNMSYGSALAWLLFVIILIVTILLFSTAKYWVYYAGDGRS